MSVSIGRRLSRVGKDISTDRFVRAVLSCFRQGKISPQASVGKGFGALRLRKVRQVVGVVHTVRGSGVSGLLPTPRTRDSRLLSQTSGRIARLGTRIRHLGRTNTPSIRSEQGLKRIIELLRGTFSRGGFGGTRGKASCFITPICLRVLLCGMGRVYSWRCAERTVYQKCKVVGNPLRYWWPV